MTGKFKLEITLGNEAMQEPDDIANALRIVASKLMQGQDDSHIFDVNGNTVGWFKFQPEGKRKL